MVLYLQPYASGRGGAIKLQFANYLPPMHMVSI